jgi:hypothetical protein
MKKLIIDNQDLDDEFIERDLQFVQLYDKYMNGEIK